MLAHVALLAALQGEPSVAFTFADPRIRESSGLAAASSGELLYTHNDSGDPARFFAVGPDGRTRTTYVVPGVAARDWEDMARGPDEQGRSCLWLADIGDNNALRENGVLLRRVREPAPTDADQVMTEPSTDFRLRYPDGPGDAETLLVHPRTGRVFVVTKPLAGAARVYAAPQPLDPDGPNVLEQVATAVTRSTGTPGGPRIGGLANYLVTGGDIAPDGSRVALRTYTDVYEWTVPGDDVGAAFAGTPTVTALPAREQGEGLTYAPDGRSVLLSTEGSGSPVDRVVLRAGRAPRRAPSAAQDQPAGTAAAPDRSALLAASAAGAAVVLAALLLLRRRRGRARG